MSKVIWKFPLKTENTQELSLPKGAEILCVQAQFDNPCLWALVEEGFTEKRTFEVFGTGQHIHYGMGVERKYIGSFQTEEGVYIWHVFERIN